MHKDGVNLDLQFDEIDSIKADNTEIIFENKNEFLKIYPKRISMKDVLASGQKNRSINGKNIKYYKLEKKINIKCEGGTLNKHEEIKVFAKLDQEKVEVGKLMVYKNNIIPLAEIVVIKVKTKPNDNFSMKGDYQFLFKNQSFNQALIRAEVKVDTNFDLIALKSNSDVQAFLSTMNTLSASQVQKNFGKLYDKYGKFKVSGGLDGNLNKRTYIFLTSLSAGNTLGICSLSATNVWGNQYVVFNAGLKDYHTIVHECGHSLSLPHVFQEGSLAKYTFYHGYTDNYMDYTWQAGNFINGQLYSSGSNKYKDKMFSFYKWQWDIMRSDRSLINNY